LAFALAAGFVLAVVRGFGAAFGFAVVPFAARDEARFSLRTPGRDRGRFPITPLSPSALIVSAGELSRSRVANDSLRAGASAAAFAFAPTPGYP